MQSKKDPTPQQMTPRGEKEKLNDKVKVILRVRPFVEVEDPEEFISAQEKNTISINKPGLTSYMKFSYVQHVRHEAENNDTQKQIFNSVDEAVKCIFEGVDSTIFAYGQTGAGKTYTIIGNCPENNSDFDYYKSTLSSMERGILPRSLELIFDEQKRRRNSRITISFYEIYNERIFDLLSNSHEPLEIREGRNGEITIAGLSAVEVLNMKEVLNFLAEGISNRATSSTSANIKSSRSHSIFHVKYEQLVVNQETKEHEVVVANLRVVDLAGSEKFNIPYDLPQAEKDLKLLEIKSINGSLSKLGHCISALTIQSRTHIPVRDSKLTRILSESLLGSGKIRLIICVSPSMSALYETMSTLQFADRVKKAVFQKHAVAHSVEKRQTVDLEEYRSLQQELQRERSRRVELERMMVDMKIHPQEMYLVRQNEKLRHEVATLREQLKVYNNHDKMNLSKAKDQPPHPQKRNMTPNLSPRVDNTKKTPTKPSQNITQKVRSTQPLNKDNYVNVKAANTPSKGMGPKSAHDFENKSQRQSVDDHSQLKQVIGKRVRKEQSFENKIKMFMERSDVDRQLQEKVKRRLLQIKQEIAKGSHEWEGEEANDTERLWQK